MLVRQLRVCKTHPHMIFCYVVAWLLSESHGFRERINFKAQPSTALWRTMLVDVRSSWLETLLAPKGLLLPHLPLSRWGLESLQKGGVASCPFAEQILAGSRLTSR